MNLNDLPALRGAHMPKTACFTEASVNAIAASDTTATSAGCRKRKRKLPSTSTSEEEAPLPTRSRGINLLTPAQWRKIHLSSPTQAQTGPNAECSSSDGYGSGSNSESMCSSVGSSMDSGNTSSSATSVSSGRSLSLRNAATKQFFAVPATASSKAGGSSTQRKGPVTSAASVPPVEFLANILRERNYDTSQLNALQTLYHRVPTQKQITDYDKSMVDAVRKCDLEGLAELCRAGKTFTACNKYGESVLHMACRRGSIPVITCLVSNGADVKTSDDFGRTPLHDACWTINPSFELIEFLCNLDLALLRVMDCRGCSPLAYVRRESWGEWNAFLTSMKEKWWPHRDASGHIVANEHESR